MTNWNHDISTTTVPMVTKLGRMVTYLDGLLPIKSHDPLITCCCEIMWQPKIIISLLPQCLWPYNLAGYWTTMRGFYSKYQSVLWSSGLERSRDKLKQLYLRYHNIYGQKTCRNGDLTWLIFTHKVKWPYNHVVLQDHVTNEKRYISSTTMPMTTTLGRMMAYLDWLLPIKSHHCIIF